MLLELAGKLGDKDGLLAVFNPLPEPVARSLRVNLYYTGLTDIARVRHEDGPVHTMELARNYTVELPVQVAGQGMTWFVIE